MSNVKKGKSPEDLGIEIPEGKQYASRDFKVKYCPGCEEAGKRNFNDNSLSVNMSKGVANCHKCGTTFSWKGSGKSESGPLSYDLPEDKLQPVGKEVMKFIKSRGIYDDDVINACVKQEMRYDKSVNKEVPWLAFPYYKVVDNNNVLINVKYRSIRDKAFAQSKNGEPTLWLSHMAKGAKIVVITEGEFDALAIMASLGIEYMKDNSIMVLSMNSGAINEKDKDISGKLKGFTNSYESCITPADTVILSTDSDPQGERLKQELKMRIDKQVKAMRFGDSKDANDLLQNKGPEDVKKALEASEVELPDGVSRLDDFRDKLWDQYNNGLHKGTSTYFKPVDEMWRWRPSDANVATGYANEGKTTWFLHLAMIACIFEPNRKFLVFSPESVPQEEFFEDLIHSYVGKTSDIDSPYRMSEKEFDDAMDFMNKHFLLLYPIRKNDDGTEEENFTMSTIEAKIIETKRTDDITDVIIDPYNMVEHDLNISDREDLYISKFMTKLKRIAIRCFVSVTLVAHQVTPRPDPKTGNYPMPSMYNVKGGGTFADKADNVLIFWRPFKRRQDLDNIPDEYKKFIDNPMFDERKKRTIMSSITLFISEKIKKQKLVAKPGEAILLYDFRTARYFAVTDINDVHGKSPIADRTGKSHEEEIAEIEEEYKPNVKDIKIESIPDLDDDDLGDVPF